VASVRIADSVGRVLGGRYRLTRPLGSGASAHVYVAEDVNLRRRVAVKLLHPGLADDEAFRRRFRAEARAVALLRHPHILRVYDWGNDDGSPFLVTELLEGGNLRSLLDRGHLLTPSQATALGKAAASALDHAHKRGLVHRDIKPANLLFDDEGRVSVADFGLARALAEATWTEPAGAILGTARYAAPEQIRGRLLDSKADVYALALVLTEATTGVVPFAVDTTIGTLMARIEQPLVVPAEVGPLAEILEAAGTVEPDDRLDAAGLAAALEQLARRLPPPADLPLVGPLTDGLAEEDQDPTLIPGVLPGASVPARPPAGRSVLVERNEPGPTGDLDVTAPVPLPAPGAAGVAPSPAPTAPGTAAVGAVAVGGPAGAPPAWPDPVPAEPEPAESDAVPVAPDGVLVAPDGVPVAPDPGAGAGARDRAGSDEPAPPRPTRRWRRSLAVVAVVVAVVVAALGVLIAERPPPLVVVPDLVGRSEPAAARLLRAEHLVLAVAGHRYDASAQRGTVISQSPASPRLREHQTVRVVVSLGPRPVAVPALAGLSEAAAEQRLRAVHLAVGPVQTTTSISVPAGDVISATPSSGTLLPGQRVSLVVSSGKPSVVVPLLAGAEVQSYAAAAAALAADHLVAVEQLVYSDVVPSGEVVVTAPAPHASVLYGSTVTVEISRGPDYIDIPTLRGDSVAEATNALQAAGFTVSGVTGNPNGTVRSTVPAAGTAAIAGSSVQIVTR